MPGALRDIDYVRVGVDKACAAFDARIAAKEFRRSRKMFWTRRTHHTLEFIHFFRSGSSYGTPINASVTFRVHFGVRVLNDPCPSLVLNGPDSDKSPIEDRYHLRFNAKSGSTFDRCVDDLVRLVERYGEPWFQSAASVEALLAPGSVIGAESRDALQRALAGEGSAERERASLKLLGIKAS